MRSKVEPAAYIRYEEGSILLDNQHCESKDFKEKAFAASGK